jgi:hypothetical protein
MLGNEQFGRGLANLQAIPQQIAVLPLSGTRPGSGHEGGQRFRGRLVGTDGPRSAVLNIRDDSQ